jgi:hypothetical protein
MDNLKPDIIARIHLYPTDQGGRQKVIPPSRFGCPFFFAGQGFDCRLLLDQVGVSLAPGTTAEVPIKFLYPELVKTKLTPGSRFKLWEAGDFADGEVLEIIT